MADPGDPRCDAELLNRYATTGDQRAFAALVERYAPLVWAVCSRQLRNPSDAEDAFQATFIALSQKGADLTGRGPVAGWLHEVARRSAAHVYRQSLRRREVSVSAAPELPALPDGPDRELAAVLDEEIGRLPSKLREPLILCHLQSRTYAEAAVALGCSVATVCRRVAEACDRLRGRLTKRGVAPIGGLAVLLALLPRPGMAMPPDLVARTLGGAGVAAGGTAAGVTATAGSKAVAGAVLKGMAGAKVGTAVAASVLAASVLVAVAGVGAVAAWKWSGRANAPPPAASDPAAVAQAAEEKAASEFGPRLDRFGDPLPAGAIARIGTLRLRTEFGGDGGVAFLPGGTSVASVHGGPVVVLWDIASGRELQRVTGPTGASAVGVSPDGRRLVAAGRGEVWAWDLTPGGPRPLWSFARSGAYFHSFAFRPGGTEVVVGGSRTNVVSLDVATGTVVRTYPANGVRQLAFSPDGAAVIGVERHQTLPTSTARLVGWDAGTGRALAGLDALREHRMAAVAWVRADRLAWSGANGGGHLYDVTAAREVAAWDGPAASVLAAGPDGAVIEVAGGRVIYRDPDTGAVLRGTDVIPEFGMLQERPFPDGRVVSADGRRFAIAASGQVFLRDLIADTELGPVGRMHGPVRTLTFTADGNQVVTLSGILSGAGRLWDATTGRPGAMLQQDPRFEYLAGPVWADNGGVAVMLSRPGEYVPRRLVTWDPATGEARAEVAPPHGLTEMPGGALSADGRWLFWWDARTVAVLDRATGVERNRFATPTIGVKGLAMVVPSADGRVLTRQPHGKGIIEVWDAERGELKHTLKSPGAPALARIALAPDGARLAATRTGVNVTPGPMLLADLTTGRTAEVDGPPSLVRAMTFGPDGRFVAAGCSDGAVWVYDVTADRPRPPLRGHTAPVNAVAFAPDGRRLASGSADGTGLVWDFAGYAGGAP